MLVEAPHNKVVSKLVGCAVVTSRWVDGMQVRNEKNKEIVSVRLMCIWFAETK